MNTQPQPVILEPLLMPRIWGGRRLETRLHKRLPPGATIGESWELVDLPGVESTVRGGPLAGATPAQLARSWGAGLLGARAAPAERIPLLLKYLDAREHLSIQVHPSAARGPAADVKDEAWYVIEAEAEAELWIGLRPGVTATDVARRAGTPALLECLQRWPARPGDLYFLPSGVVHALGAGVLVAEVQTPADVTYRLFDWDRRDAAGRPRELHTAAALTHLRAGSEQGGLVRAATLEAPAFTIVPRSAPELSGAQPDGRLRVWMVFSGAGELRWPGGTLDFRCGDSLLIPAGCPPVHCAADDELRLLEVAPADRSAARPPTTEPATGPPTGPATDTTGAGA